MSESEPGSMVAGLPYAWGPPVTGGVIRASAEDFRVDELLGFEPDGDGQHRLLQLRKRGMNTDWLAQEIARFAGVSPAAVSYAGLKDRHAVTSQWFSIDLAGRPEPDWQALEGPDLQLLQVAPHRRKLRRGALRGNRFTLLLREVDGDPRQIDARLQMIATGGVPNYFGAQRFGHGESNLVMAQRLFAGELTRLGRHKRGIYLSAARSRLFNLVLAARVGRGDWNRLLPGEVAILDGRHAHFWVEALDAELEARAERQEIHPSGPMWGRGTGAVGGEPAQLEQNLLEPEAEWCAGLERFGLEQERRPLRLRVADLEWSRPAEGVLELGFSLTAGGYATVVLRELCTCDGSVAEAE